MAILVREVHIYHSSPLTQFLCNNLSVRLLFISDRGCDDLQSEYSRLSNAVKFAIREFSSTRIDNFCTCSDAHVAIEIPNIALNKEDV